MKDEATLHIGSLVEVEYHSKTRLAVVMGIQSEDSSYARLGTGTEFDVVPLAEGELVEDGKIINPLVPTPAVRRLYAVNKAQIKRKLGAVKPEIVGTLWNEVVRYGALQHYRTVHQPKTQLKFEVGDRLPYAGRVFDEHEVLNLIDSSLEFWLTSGRFTERFERDLAKYLRVRKSLLVNSGSSANLVAFSTLTSPSLGARQILPGDEVITVAAGFPTTITPAMQYGAVPVFVDVETETHNIDVTLLESARSDRTKAVMVAHALGNPFNLGAVKAFCDKYELWLIEDNCDALGAEYFIDGEWKLTGTIGDIGTSSFYPPHHMTMGEGGAVYMKNPKLAKIAASFRDWGRDCYCPAGVDNTCGKRFDWQLGELPQGYDHKYIYSHFGYNLKATDMQASIGCAQLEKIHSFIQARRRNFSYLYEGLRSLEDIFWLPRATANSNPSWFGFFLNLRTSNPTRRAKIVTELEARGIQTRMLFAGNFTRHPVFNQIRGNSSRYRIVGELKNSDHLMMNGFWVGVYPGLNEQMLEYMVQSIRDVARMS